MAADVTQAVFLLLSRKAARLRRHAVLSAWLLTTTRLVCRATLRKEIRRQQREQEAAAMPNLEEQSEVQSAWEQVQPMLDEALAALSESDRNLVALRFFEQKSHAEIAAALGLSEEASKKRLSRAVERLRAFLSRRGNALAAAALLAAISQNAVQAAPAGLAPAITATVAGGSAGATVTALVNITQKLMTWTKIKIAIVSAIAVAALAAPIVLQHQSLGKLRAENQALQRQAAPLALLQAENLRLSNLVVQAKTGQALTEQQVRELARLRDEVARLRQQTNGLARAQTGIRQPNRPPTATNGRGRAFHNITSAEFAKFIGGVLHAPVADQTGLTGAYDIEMTPPRPGGVDGMLERVKGILSNELGLQLIPFDGPFTTNEGDYDEGELTIVRNADGTYTQLTNRVFMRKPDGLYGQLADGSFANVAPTASVPKGGFAIKLDKAGAPGIRPTTGELGAQTGLYDDATQGLPGEIANQLMAIERAKAQWAHAQNKQNADTPTWEDIRLYLGRAPNGNMNDYTNSQDGEFIIGSVGSKALLRAGSTAEADWKHPRKLVAADPADTDQCNQCISNLRLIDSAKQQWALENHGQIFDTPTMEDLKKYMGHALDGELPVCPDGGVYTPGTMGEKPTCSIPGHVLP